MTRYLQTTRQARTMGWVAGISTLWSVPLGAVALSGYPIAALFLVGTVPLALLSGSVALGTWLWACARLGSEQGLGALVDVVVTSAGRDASR